MDPQIKITNVLLLYVGGRIGMEKNDDGVYVPVPNKFLGKLKSNPQLHDPDLANEYFPDIKDTQLVLPQLESNVVRYELKEYDPLLDSSNMAPADWIKIVKSIQENYNSFDGFVILHGTDTLSYTASALSFMIETLHKPVIVTGAQISLFEPRNDAVSNVVSSLILSGCYKIPEACVFFGNKLLRGNRTTKAYLPKLNAFDSPNYDVLANTEVGITVNNDRIRKPSTNPFKVNTNLNTEVGILTFCPTITPLMIERFLQEPMSGVIIQSYGAGNIPSNQTQLVEVLKKAVERGVFIVNTTVCLQGSVSDIHETEKILDDIGVITGQDMTVETALTKFPSLSYEERAKLIKANIRGELTPSINKEK